MSEETGIGEILLQKKLLILSTAMMAIASVFWGAVYYYYDEFLAGMIPWTYLVLSVFSLTILRGPRGIELFRLSQLGLSLLFPFALMWTLGGFVNSSAVILWSLISPMGALVFSGRRAADFWFLAFCLLVLASIFIQFPAVQHDNNLPDIVIAAFFVLNLTGVSVVAFVLLRYFVGEKDAVLALLDRERDRSESLVRNMLPEAISERLKQEQRPIADQLEGVTILFADIVGFTRFAMINPPEKVVSLLDRIFSDFDQIADDMGLEKIKTIGDAYMLCGGLEGNADQDAQKCAEFALVAMDYMNRLMEETGDGLDFRIGLNTGTVIAGVIGTSKFSYDIWGDAVNIAARVQQGAEIGTIVLSEQTAHMLPDDFVLIPLGEMKLKGRSSVMTYELSGRLPAAQAQ